MCICTYVLCYTINFLYLKIIINLLCVVTITLCDTAMAEPAPHIIFIMVDDMGWNDIGYRSTTEMVTPTLTELATRNGVRLENYYTGPTCGPTRSQFLSGIADWISGGFSSLLKGWLHKAGSTRATKAEECL